jgi:putative copper export protein
MSDNVQDVLLAVATWVGLTGVLVVSGAGLFSLAVWYRGAIPGRPRPQEVERVLAHRWNRLVAVAWVFAALGSLSSFVLAEDWAAEGLRLALVVLPAAVWLVRSRLRRGLMQPAPARTGGPSIPAGPDRQPAAPGRSGGAGSRRSRALDAVSILALLLAAALAGHARGSSPLIPNVAVALVHVAGIAAWAGGLVALVAMAFPAARVLDEGERVRVLAPVVARFSDVAVVAVFAIVASGVYSSWVEIRTLGALTGSTYGLVFLGKLAAFLPAVALGAVNNRWTRPRLLQAAREDRPGLRALALLRRSIAMEVALVAVVLALTAALLSLTPPIRESLG